MHNGLSLAVLLLSMAAHSHYDVSASFVPAAKPGERASISVLFTPKDPDVRINELPPPRLRLDPAQQVLLDKQPPPPTRTPDWDPETAHYIDTAFPVPFPVALRPGVAKGRHDVNATLTYFYCSKREGWCRKGTAELDVAVDVP